MNLYRQLVLVFIISITVAFLMKQDFIREPTVGFINSNIPWSVAAFNFIRSNVAGGTLTGLTMYLVFANIPFIPSLPAEAYVIFSHVKGANVIGILGITTSIYVCFATFY